MERQVSQGILVVVAYDRNPFFQFKFDHQMSRSANDQTKLLPLLEFLKHFAVYAG